MKKDEKKFTFSYEEADIAKVAGISMGAYRVAKTRGKINPGELRSVAGFIFLHWVTKVYGEEGRCVHRHTRKSHPKCFEKEAK